MNFFLCNRCNKNSDENIFNFNHEEINLKETNHYYTNIDNNYNMICPTNTSEKFPDININNLEDDDDDDLKIIEYPYKLREENDSNNENKLKPKEFKKNKSKFCDNNNNISKNNNNYLIEKDIINKLNYIDKNKDSSKFKNFKYLIIPKNNNNNNNVNDRVIEKKDTLTDLSNLALSSLMFEINKTNKNKSKLNKIEEKQEINSTQNETNYNNNKNKNDNKTSNNKNKKYKFTRKVQRKDYPNNIIKKRNILKINNIYNNNMYNNNLKFLNLYTNSKKKIPKSKSFNFSQTDKNNSIKIRTEINNIDKYKFNINLPINNNKVKTVFTPQINQNKINYKMKKSNIEKNKK